ncbi:hypothetical protein GCM10008983_18950 [Lentibacillus halophilus]|uniref:Host cell surface-exposed lipoprotein n=1 Tax=Lentibacillus halophilus TaxID=295065 RepID=A0ABN0ZBL8_9BACI
MKRAIKYGLLGVLLVLILVSGWVYYLFNIKTYDTQDDRVSEITDSTYALDIPTFTKQQPDTTKSQDATANNNEVSSQVNNDKNNEDPEINASNDQEKANDQTNTPSTPQSSKEDSANTSDSNTTKSTSNHGSDKPTQKEIKQGYRPAFKGLQDQATEKLNRLLSLAYNEYKDKKSNNSDISYSYFYQKYKTAGEKLEANTTEAFQQLYSALQADLKAHGYSASAASEFKEDYEEAKEARKNAIIQKAKSILK